MSPSRIRDAAYYHLWTNVILYDKPQLFGKAKRREDSSDQSSASVFENSEEMEMNVSSLLK